MQEIIIDEKTAGGRIDKLIFHYLDKASPGFVYKMLRKKNIMLNDKKASGSEILQPGDHIKLYLSDETIDHFKSSARKHFPDHSARDFKERRKAALQASLDKGPTALKDSLHMNPALSAATEYQLLSEIRAEDIIVYEDEHIIAFNKPAGLLSQRSQPGDISLNDILCSYIESSDIFKPGISNRLDRNTSGLVLAGKNPNAVRLLNDAVKNRCLKKLYTCLVRGKLDTGMDLEGYLVKNTQSNTVGIFSSPDEIQNFPPHRKRAYTDAAYIRTSYSVISSNERLSLLSVDLITGKAHQIRAHLASIGHPILADHKYSDITADAALIHKYHLRRQMLHAHKIIFTQMAGMLSYLNGKEITAAIPEDINRVIEGEKLCLPGSHAD